MRPAASAPAAVPSSVHGPFAFAQGGFYALSASTVAWAFPLSGAPPNAVVQRMRAVVDAAPSAEEDLIVGYLVHRLGATANLSLLRLNLAAYQHDMINEFGPTRLNHLLQQIRCGRTRPFANLSIAELTTGTLAPGNLPELVAPTSVALHRVRTCEQRRRAWALAQHWTQRLHRLGHPECVYSHVRSVLRESPHNTAWTARL